MQPNKLESNEPNAQTTYESAALAQAGYAMAEARRKGLDAAALTVVVCGAFPDIVIRFRERAMICGTADDIDHAISSAARFYFD